MLAVPTLFADLPVCGIGSLPYSEPETALDLIAENMPQIPHWPQLPRRTRLEGLTHQYLAPLVDLGLLHQGEKSWEFNPEEEGWLENLTAFFDLYLAAAEGDQQACLRFAPAREAAEGLYSFLEQFAARFPEARWAKGQIAGPVSVGLTLADCQGRPAYYDAQLRELVVKCLAQGAAWQTKALSVFGVPPVVFVDDPALGAWGTSAHIGLNRDDIIQDLAEIAEAVRAAGGTPGAHSCAAIDWSMLIEAGFDIISFDAYAYFSSLVSYSSMLDRFLKNGGVLAWGVVPTSEEAREQTPENLARLWWREVEELAGKGIDQDLIRRQSLISPSCGTGLLDEDLARWVYRLTASTAETVRAG